MATVYVGKVNKSDYQSNEEYKLAQATSVEQAIKKLRKKVANEGTLKKYRDNMYYKSRGEIAREKKRAAGRKQYRERVKQEKYNRD